MVIRQKKITANAANKWSKSRKFTVSYILSLRTCDGLSVAGTAITLWFNKLFHQYYLSVHPGLIIQTSSL